MIEAVELSKKYGQIEAVKGISFAVADGEIVGLLGPNGAGKTTTMRMLTTFLAPSSGTAKVAGFDINKQPEDVRRNIGYLPEHPPIYPELTVREYLSFVGKIRGIGRAQLKQAIEEMLSKCALTGVADRLCGQVSKGYRQRIGLAQALIHKPRVIILDEPTIGLDPTQIIEIRNLIRELRGKHTVVLSSHILPEVAETCSQVIIIAHGRITVFGQLSELTKDKTLEERFLEAVSTDTVAEPAVEEASPEVQR